MRFSVRHESVYSYSAPVRLAEHVLRFNPRPDAGRLMSRTLDIEPQPSARVDELDGFGNLVTRVGFDGSTEVFRIVSRFELEVGEAARGSAPDGETYLGDGPIDEAVRVFAHDLAAQSGGDLLEFLDRLNATIFRDIRHDIRPEGAARRPEQTLALAHGACRDVTTLFIAACRSLGVPARVVSGYQAKADTPDGRRHLHAWPEAFVPGSGWLAYDPTHGIAVADAHVALCAAPEQAPTMPVEGGFYGAGVTSQLSYSVEIDAA